MDLLQSYNREGVWSFCVSVVIFHFVLLALNCARQGSLECWLGYICKCEASGHKSTCYCFFFTRTKQPRTFPTICSNPCTTAVFKARSQQLATDRSNGQHWDQYSSQDGDMKQLLWDSGPVPCIASVSTHAQNAFNFKLGLFKKCKDSTEAKIKFISMYKKNSRELR